MRTLRWGLGLGWLVGCAGPQGDSADNTKGVPDPLLCPWGALRSETSRSVEGFLYDVAGQVGLEGAAVSRCGDPEGGVLTDADGRWTLDTPDRDWVVVDQVRDQYVPNRCVFDPMVEGREDAPYRIGMSTFEQENFPMEHLGVVPREGFTWVDIDAIDLDTGLDLPGTTVDITAPYEAAIGQTEEDGFFFSNETHLEFDVYFANVEPVAFDVIASHPDKSECLVPPTMRGEGNDQLNLTVYCR